MYQLGSWSVQFFPSGEKMCLLYQGYVVRTVYFNTLLWLRHRIMAIGVEIPLYHHTGMELQPFKVIYATSTALNCCALRPPSISFLWGCRKLFANNTGIFIIQVWLYWGTKYTCTTLCNDFAMLSLIGNEETDARVHVRAIYCGHIKKHVIQEP